MSRVEAMVTEEVAQAPSGNAEQLDLPERTIGEIATRMRILVAKTKLARRVINGVDVGALRDFGAAHGYHGKYDSEGVKRVKGFADGVDDSGVGEYMREQFYHNTRGPGVVIAGRTELGKQTQAVGDAIESLSNLVDGAELEIEDQKVREIAEKFTRAMIGKL